MPLDRCRRDLTLFQFTARRLRDFIDLDHLLIRIDEQLDFAKLVAPLEARYCPDFGKPAIHPEVMVRALLICSLYNIASFRRLCSAISENLAYRWCCFLTIDDPVFDHSSISHFINRIGREGFGQIFEVLNQELLRLGLLSPETYVDSSLVKANMSGYDLVPSGMTVAEFKEQAIEVNGSPICLTGFRCRRYHWLQTPATAKAPSVSYWRCEDHGLYPDPHQAGNSMVARGDFAYHGDHLICPQGKVLRRKSFHRRSRSHQYLARQRDCQACPIKDTCLPPWHKQRYISPTMYHPLYERARERNRTAAYRREHRRRQPIAEGTFASLDRLSWARSRLRGLWKLDCEGSAMSSEPPCPTRRPLAPHFACVSSGYVGWARV